MEKFRAPFNFVPLNQTVVFPEWANRISQDIPFSDAISGTLELAVHAESDIFIRNGHTRDESDASFSKTADGRYFIPATSLKGAVRNVLEILSFGKVQNVVNRHFGLRDLNDTKFYGKKIRPGNIHCGWLYREDETYHLTDCGKPWRIAAEELDRHFGTSLLSFIHTGNFRDDRNRMAQAKYTMFESFGSLTGTFKSCDRLKNGLKVVQFSEQGTSGQVVFTGQTSGGNKEKVKVYEFVFPNDPDMTKDILVPDTIFQEFDSIHQTSSDYVDYWFKKLNTGERIPVFFMYKGNEDDGELDAMGLAFMFRYPAFHSVYDAIPDNLLSMRPDLASCIFGFSNKYKSLRGRVQFGHAFADGIPEERPEYTISMASPKPSFYPFYLGHGNTWNTKGEIQIAGRKRYPVRSVLQPFEVATANMENRMRPLSQGTVFKGYIHFHNLRRVELGALVSALTFHGHSECVHQLGGAKPFGYGKVRFHVKVKDADCTCSLSDVMKEFEIWMTEKKNDWLYSQELKELFAMAKGIPEGRESEFTYMKMSTTGCNEFKEAKEAYCKNGMQLGSFTQILTGIVPKTPLNPPISPDGNWERKNKEIFLKEEVRKLKEEDLSENQKSILYRAIQFAWEHENYREYLDLLVQVKDNVCKRQWLEQWEQRNEECCADIKNQVDIADGCRANKQYNEALELYRKSMQDCERYESQGFSCSCHVEPYIAECEQKIAEEKSLAGMGFSDFLDTLKYTSLPALGNNLKKWIQKQGDLSDADSQLLAEKIYSVIGTLSEKEMKNFFSKNNCQKFEKSVGNRIAEKIYIKFQL